MGRPKTEGRYSDADRILAFYQRATVIRKHPLFGHPDASLIHPNLPERVTLQEVQDNPGKHKIESFDYKLFAPAQWIDLACLVRPLIFSSDDKIRMNLIIPMISQASPELKKYTDIVNADFKKWLKTTFFYAGEIDAEPEAPDSGTIEIAQDLDFDVSEMSGDYKMAMNYFNGELFHVNMDHWSYMSEFNGGQARSMYLKAAQFRVIDSCRHIENVRQIIMVGWLTGHLPVHPALEEAVRQAEPPSQPLMIQVTQVPDGIPQSGSEDGHDKPQEGTSQDQPDGDR